jgi:streptogramin lyase
MECLEDRCLLSGGVGDFPCGPAPFDIASGSPDGNLWFTESGANKIGKMTTAGVLAGEFSTQTPNSTPLGITHGGGGATDTGYWFAEAGGISGQSKIELIDSSNGAITNQIVTNDDPKMITSFIALYNGLPYPALWYTDTANNRIGTVTTSGAQLPHIVLPGGAEPWGITVGLNGNIWFTEAGRSMIGAANIYSRTFSEFALPANSQPRNITARPDGVWFTEDNGNKIGTLDYNGKNYREFVVPTQNSHPWGITTIGTDDTIWFTESATGASKIGRLDDTGVIKEFTLPRAATTSYGITAGSDGNVWFDEYNAAAIGRIALDKPLHATGKTVAATEGGSFAGVVASFTDDDPLAVASNFTATIDWGNNFTSAGTIVKNGKGFDVVGNSVSYAEEGAYSIKVAITDIDDGHDLGGSTAEATSPIKVADAPLGGGGFLFNAGEGAAFTNQPLAYAIDFGGPEPLSSYTVTIDWGDKSPTSSGTLTVINGLFQVTGSHTYAEEGGYPVASTVRDEGGSSTTLSSTANVNDAGLIPTAVSLSGTEPAVFTNVPVATFTDAGGPEDPSNYTTTINWGDNTPTQSGSVVFANGVFSVVGSHTYSDECSCTITVSILDAEGLPYYVFSTVNIGDAPLTPVGTTVGMTEGTFFSGAVGSFYDAAGREAPNAYDVVVDWGDNHQSSALLQPNAAGGYDIIGDHSYAEEGTYNITASVQDDGGSNTIVASKANVVDAPLSAVAFGFSGTTGVPINNQLLAIFADAASPEPVTNYSASVDWGDSSVDMATISPLGTLFLVNDSHTYSSSGSFTVTVKITDEGGSLVSATATATILGQGPSPGGANPFALLQENVDRPVDEVINATRGPLHGDMPKPAAASASVTSLDHDLSRQVVDKLFGQVVQASANRRSPHLVAPTRMQRDWQVLTPAPGGKSEPIDWLTLADPWV